jgi:hypothetical protein
MKSIGIPRLAVEDSAIDFFCLIQIAALMKAHGFVDAEGIEIHISEYATPSWLKPAKSLKFFVANSTK